MIKKLLIALFVSLLSIVIIFLLHVQSDPVQHANGFKRKFLRSSPKAILVKDLNYLYYYVAGASNSTVYLGNYRNTPYLLQYNMANSKTSSVHIQVPRSISLAWKLLQVQVDSPCIYLMEGLTPRILYRSFSDSVWKQPPFSLPNFSASLALSPSSFILRNYSTQLQQYILTKKNSNPVDTVNYILSKEQEGTFSLDGLLLKNNSRFFYIYFYKNQFECLDTNLHRMYTGFSIDTFAHPHIHIDTIHREHKSTFSAPPLLVNAVATANQSYLLIRSAVKADNESLKQWKSVSVLDVYSINSGTYKGSFYIPDYKGEKITEMQLKYHQLITIQKKYLLIYDLTTLGL